MSPHAGKGSFPGEGGETEAGAGGRRWTRRDRGTEGRRVVVLPCYELQSLMFLLHSLSLAS